MSSINIDTSHQVEGSGQLQSRESRQVLEGSSLAAYQLERFNELVARIFPSNRFYSDKLSEVELPLTSLEQLQRLPFTFKDELVSGRPQGSFAANLTFPHDQYTRFHRTSGTQGQPMVVIDTAEDWDWWVDGCQFTLDAADACPEDRAVIAFSFGPSNSFWSVFDAAVARGMMVAPSGGASSLQRLNLIRESNANFLVSTPSYALHLADVAKLNQIDVANLGVNTIIVAGEPGGSLPEIRDQIESLWDARVFDQASASEVGPWGFTSDERDGLYVNESEFIAEFRSLETGEPSIEGELSELVLTTLGRYGCPVIRYRTGDLVRPQWNHSGKCRFVLLKGGVLGRVDDMMIIRGVNVFPSSIEQILRSFPEIIEHRITATKSGALDALTIEVEDRFEEPARVANELKLKIGLTVDVVCVPIGTLPRFESIGKRFVDRR